MRERLLVVEDSPTQAERLRYLLADAGYEVSVAGSGEEALTTLASTDFALVVSDILMPGLDGYELCRQIRANPEYNGVRVVLLTTLSDPIDIIRGLECGADNYILKPYDAGSLLARVRAALSARVLRRESRSSLGLTLSFLGTTFVINSAREQILDLFISSVEDIVRTKNSLEDSQRQLAAAHEQLASYARQMAHRAQVSTEKFGALMRHASDMILVLDGEQRIVEANERAADLLGRPAAELAGVGLRELLAPEQGERRVQVWMELRETQRIERAEIVFLNARGEAVWCEFSAVAAPGETDGLVLGIFRDITDRKRAERERELLAEISDLMASSLDYRVTLQAVARGAAQLLGDFCVVDVLGARLERIAMAHADEARTPTIERARAFVPDPAHARHPIAQVLRTREALLVERADDAYLEAIALSPEHLAYLCDELRVHSLLTVPLLTGGRVLGTLTVTASDASRPLGAHELALAREIARRAAQALDNAMLYQATQNARAEEQAAKLRVTSILESIQDAFVALDREWCFTYANPKALELAASGFGRDADKFIGSRLWDLFPDFQRSPLCQQLQNALAERGTVSAEAFVQALGSWMEVRAYPSAEGISVYFQDVTARKQAENALRESEERFRQLAENLDHVIWLRDQASGAVLYVNRAFEVLWGVPRAALYEDPARWLEGVHPEDRQRVHAADTDAEDGEYAAEFRLVRPEGGTCWVRARGFGIRDESGQTFRRAVIIEDLTEARRAEEALRESELLLRQSQKMEAIGQLAGGVAHDFNNVLTAIRCSSDFLLDDLSEDDPRREDAVEIRSATERAAGLTRQLLAFSRQQVLQVRVLDVCSIVEHTEGMLRRLIGEDIDLRLELPAIPNMVRADPSQLEQVILNLVVNARDAMPDGGRLILKVARVSVLAETPGLAELPAGEYTVLSVSDTGCGIPPEIQERVFDPFFTTKGPEHGTGLGLSTVYGIVEQSGGRIVVESQVGVGTTFRMYLARCEEAAPQALPGETPRSAVRGTETILLVEDDPAVAGLVRRVLVESGYTVLLAQHGREALSICQAHEGEIHLLLTDVIMPHMSVRALVAEVTRLYPDIRAIFMSGYTHNEIGHRGVLETGVAFLQKPFSREEVLARVEEVLRAGETLVRVFT